MEMVKTRLGKGLSSYQIKIIAVIAMTIDHLGAYGFEIPIFDAYYTKLRLIGRIAMPLFLFILTESVRYTRSRPKFLLRLYLGAVWTGLFVAVTNYLFDDSIGRFIQSNIFFQYFYTALYIILIEEIICGIRERRWTRTLLGIIGIATTCVVHYLCVLIDNVNIMDYGASLETVFLINEIAGSFLVSPLGVEYTLLFVAMGILMYFAKNKFGKALVLAVFSFYCYAATYLRPFLELPFDFVLGYPQYYMVMAVPFILLYNGEKGRGDKYFFYLYYPLHRYAISIAVCIYHLFSSQ